MRYLAAVCFVAYLAATVVADDASTQPAKGKLVGKLPASMPKDSWSDGSRPEKKPIWQVQAVFSKGKCAIISGCIVDFAAGTAAPLISLWSGKPQPATDKPWDGVSVGFVAISPDERFMLMKGNASRVDYLIVYDLKERKDVTITPEGEVGMACWMGQNIVVSHMRGREELLAISCYATDGKTQDFPKIFGAPLGGSADGRFLLVGAFSENLQEKIDYPQAVERAKKEGVLACLVGGDGKVLHSTKVRSFYRQSVSPNGKCFSVTNTVKTTDTRSGEFFVTQVRTTDGALIGEFKNLELPIGLLDDGRLITQRFDDDERTVGSMYKAVTIWEKSKPAVLVNAPGRFIVQGKTVYYIADEEPDAIRSIDIP